MEVYTIPLIPMILGESCLLQLTVSINPILPLPSPPPSIPFACAGPVLTSYPRVSLAHGWSTGPTNLLSRYVGGIQIIASAGQKWKIVPAVGDLTSVESGMSTTLGTFSVDITADGKGGITAFSFVTPDGTTGDVVLPSGTTGSLTSSSGETVALKDGVATEVNGGSWSLTL